MKKTIYILIAALSLISCKSKERFATIRGTGLSKNIKKLYLTSAVKWDVFLDSAVCTNGSFELTYKPTPAFEPFFASLCYLDSLGKITQLYVKNQLIIKRTGKNSANSGFMLDYGETKIYNYEYKYDGDLVDMEGGMENELFQKYEWQNFGYLSSTKDMKRLKRNTSIINEYPDSYYLLSKIIHFREQYSKEQLLDLFGRFDKEVQQSRMASSLVNYIENMPKANERVPDLNLFSDKEILTTGINKTKKINMLVFWASWCGPCRAEIPLLKKLYGIIDHNKVYLAGISIDKNRAYWKAAIAYDKPLWDQFIIDNKDIDKLMGRYRFSSIPLVIFTNQQGNEIKRISGYRSDQLNDYLNFIKEHY